jgi:hypothetical protein
MQPSAEAVMEVVVTSHSGSLRCSIFAVASRHGARFVLSAESHKDKRPCQANEAFHAYTNCGGPKRADHLTQPRLRGHNLTADHLITEETSGTAAQGDKLGIVYLRSAKKTPIPRPG